MRKGRGKRTERFPQLKSEQERERVSIDEGAEMRRDRNTHNRVEKKTDKVIFHREEFCCCSNRQQAPKSGAKRREKLVVTKSQKASEWLWLSAEITEYTSEVRCEHKISVCAVSWESPR